MKQIFTMVFDTETKELNHIGSMALSDVLQFAQQLVIDEAVKKQLPEKEVIDG